MKELLFLLEYVEVTFQIFLVKDFFLGVHLWNDNIE